MPLKIKPIKRLHLKNKKQLLFGTVVALAAVIVLAVGLAKTTDNSGDFSPYIIGDRDYPSRFYHYTSFNEDPKGKIKLSWKRNKIRLEGDSAESKILVKFYPITLDEQDRKMEYKSSDDSIATVDERGNITAHKPGNVRISAKFLKTGQTEYAELEIIRPVTGILLKKNTINMNISDAWQRLEAEIYPDDATDKTVKWESKNTKVVTIDDNGTLKPVGIGMTEVTATSQDGGFTAKCFVNVINKVIDVESVTIQNKGSERMAVGESMNMIASVLPSNAKNKIVSWSSSSQKVASISKTGKIKALAEGTTDITVKSANGKTDIMKLTVEKSSRPSALDLTDKVTSSQNIPTDILGNTYVNSGASSNHGSSSVTNGGVTYTSYNITLDSFATLQMGLYPPPKIWKGGAVSATKEETMEYMNPESYYTGAYKYQFLDLSHSNGVSADDLNRFLRGKGILSGMGQTFVDAAKEYNISEVYLVAHACLETGNGTSTLSNGVEFGGTMVYNMFGIGAYDDSALYSGSKRAYEKGWTSPEAAIKGGAAWISEWYINASSSRQNTLYKMLWNPETPGEHQYATDIGWAVKQAINIEKIFASFPDVVLSYDVPVYMGQTAITLQ